MKQENNIERGSNVLNHSLIGKIIQCHLDSGDPDTFVVGCVIWMDRDWFLMHDVSPLGDWNGIGLYMQRDVVLVKENTEYISKLNVLLEQRNSLKPLLPDIAGEPVTSLLSYLCKNKKILSLELAMSGSRNVTGFVNCISKNILTITQVDEFGKIDGLAYIPIESITRVFADDKDLKCLEALVDYYGEYQRSL